jgi:hypothetical protein
VVGAGKKAPPCSTGQTMAFVLRSGRVLKFKGRRTSYSFVTSIEARYDLATA